jgi:hypothetical protein
MRLPGSDQDSVFSVSLDSAPEAGPSSVGLDGMLMSNGHANGNGYSVPVTNGSSGNGIITGNGIQKHAKAIGRVSLPGTTLYDDSYIDREEFVRLVIQSLRDVGYRFVPSLRLVHCGLASQRVFSGNLLPRWRRSQGIRWRHLTSLTFGNTSLRLLGTMQKLP